MSTSSLTSLPAPTSDTLDIIPPRPAPKRTYGRVRPASPPPLGEASSSSSIATAQPLFTSPSKALLDRWSNANQSWRDELSKLDAPSSDKTEDIDDLEEARKEMEKLRRQARGLKALDQNQNQVQPLHSANLAIPKEKNILAQTSSLTSLPTTTASSPLRSSPPVPPPRALQAHSSETAEETMFPIRKSGMPGKPKRIIMSDEESDDAGEEPPLFVRDSSRSVTPVQYEGESTTERGSSPPSFRRPPRNGEHEDDEVDDEDMAEYLKRDNQTRVEREQQAQAELEPVRQPQSSALEGLDDLFDQDDDEEPQEKRSRVHRGLNKADKAEMEKDIARAHRERPVAFSRPEPSRLPISAWLAQANVAVQSKDRTNDRSNIPGLTFGKSPQTSPSQQTPPDDEIILFTPSSGIRHAMATTSTSRISIENPNTPTPAAKKSKGKGKAIASIEEDDEKGNEQDFMNFLDHEKKRDDKEARRKQLEEFKKRAIAAKLQQQKPMTLNLEPTKPSSDGPQEEESDFEIESETTPKKKEEPVHALGGKKISGAKAILSKTNDQSVISKQKQGFLARAGKLHKNKNHAEGISETYIDFAGKAFNHSNAKQNNAGSKPSTQKKGRDEVLSNEDFNKFIVAKHQQQVSAIARKKEEDCGRVKILPGRQEQIIQIPETQLDEQNEEDEEDDEDEEYNPDEEEDDERMVWSGEEGSGDEEEVVEEKDGESQHDDANAVDLIPETLQEDEDEEVQPVFKRKSRPSARVAFDSDDEDNAKSASWQEVPASLKKLEPQPSATLKSTTNDDGFGGFDLGGFGNGSQGFSQLFGATQAAGSENAGDAFAGLRSDHIGGFLPTQAILPEVQISKTQIERDNNLIAAEIEEAAMERMQELEKPKQQYINERGLFTQTKPPIAEVVFDDETQISQSRRNLGGLSDLSILGDQTQQTPYGKQTFTQIGTLSSDQRQSLNDTERSPTQTQDEDEEETFSRLRRRRESDPDIDQDIEPVTLSPTQAAPSAQRTVFDRMMKAASRPQKPKFKSRMVDEQAEESDEDNGWALPFGNAENEDDDDDDDQDAFLEGLVDDQQVDEEERRRQDEMVNEKNREIQAADDLRLEQEARKIIEGQHRRKKRTKDFFDDESESEDERGGKKKRLSKKQRRKRQLDREDGLDKLEGEANVFRRVYDENLESDEDEIDETPFFDIDNLPGAGRSLVSREPEELAQEDVPIAPKMTFKEKYNLLRARARQNGGKTSDELAIDDMDDEVLMPPNDPRARALKQRRNTFVDEDEDEDEQGKDAGFSISKRTSMQISATSINDKDVHRRSLASYASYVQEESQVTRRAAGGAAGVSVIRPQNSSSRSIGNGGLSSRNGSMSNMARPAPVPHPHRQSTTSSTNSGSGSVLLSKRSKFA
ncbi:uncharacterized protein I206_102298 [Kwoniella pini CBS 10737]|uniref:DNA replication checkpoint mediator MRC1 domain-containing protein n=1 Tax=Kwoniella pini CBS 10737 TaxID=1296096 RepID=A0A1B9HT42_9TREE|nr:uncharacterized protein I206_07668 [Kwoniella pini CBS 10737]OCF46434.1 hypothetical protein I206_07668 [Kwoniella pini CBS 10737]